MGSRSPQTVHKLEAVYFKRLGLHPEDLSAFVWTLLPYIVVVFVVVVVVQRLL